MLAIALAACAPGPSEQAPSVTALTPALHDRRFPIAAGSHAVDCNACHRTSDSFKGFDCLGCHSQPATPNSHANVSGFSYTSASCYACHPRGVANTIDPAVHARFFPIGPGTRHDGISCASCHVDATNRTVAGCASCHTQEATRHRAVGGFAPTDSSLCLRCHADAQVNRVAAHLPFAIQDGVKHYRESCLVCHATARSDKPFGQDFKQKDCLFCHTRRDMDDKHNGRAGYVYATPSCIGCHPAGTNP